jgi:hypothetical protein
VPKNKLVEVNLELALAHSVMGADQPLLEVSNGSVGKGDNGLRTFAQLRPEGLGASDVFETGLHETSEAFEAVRVDGGTRCDVPFNKRYYRAGFEIGNHAHAGPTGCPTTLLHCHEDEGSSPILELSAAAQTRLFTADPRVINLHLAAQRIPSPIYHRSAELVKHHPRALVREQTELTLEQQGGHSTLVRCHQIRCPKPVSQRNLRAVKDSAGSQRDLVPALGALLTPLFE